MLEHGRTNQKRRTRAALVKAALELLRSGASPTVSEVAHAALVSPATAYRYFPSARALWTAVLAEMGGPSVEDVFAGVPERDAEARVEAMIRAVGFRMFDDEALWRTAARLLHERHPSGASGSADERIPVPTGKRLRLIECALAPLARELPKGAHRRLVMSLALVMGAETVLALRDVCELEPEEAKAVALWAGRAMVRAALAEQQQRRSERPSSAKPATRKPTRKHG